MHVDKQTLVDLEIFRPTDGDRTLFDLLDKTLTAGGSNLLRQHILHPPENLELVISRQQTIRHLAQLPGTLTLPFNNVQVKSAEKYLSTNISTIQGDTLLQSLQFFLSDIQSFRFLRDCLPETISFILRFRQFLFDNYLTAIPEFRACTKELSFIAGNLNLEQALLQLKKNKFRFYQVLRLDRKLRSEMKETILGFIQKYYELDALIAMARSTRELNLQFPEIVSGTEPVFETTGLYHPLLPNPVPCNLSLLQQSNFMFLTGPNMAGKSTLLKAAGITVLFAHLGMGVPAKSARISYFDSLFTSLNVSDSVATGYSYFYNEVNRVKTLATKLNQGESVFVLIDELFRGTNVKDAYEASEMIINGLLPHSGSLFLVSSHLWEIWDKISHHPNARAYCFDSSIVGGYPAFPYTLSEGVSDTRLGMTIIINEKILTLLKTNNHDNH